MIAVQSCLKSLLLVVLMVFSVALRAEPLPAFASSDEGLLFRVAGSNTIGAKLMKGLLQDYFAAKGLQNIQVTDSDVENEYRVSGTQRGREFFVEVAAHGSTTGFDGLKARNIDFAMSSRSIKPEEVEALFPLGDMLGAAAEHVIAIDGLAVIVNRANPVNALDMATIAKIFAGQITNWSSLGGADLPISVYARDDRSGTWDTFESLVLGKSYQLVASAERFESNDQLSDRVAQDPGAIGFVGLASVRDARALKVSDVGTAALLPQKQTVATEDYVLSRRLFFYAPPTLKNATLDEFIAFAQSPAGQARVEQTGFISQSVIETEPESNREGPKAYLRSTKNAARLSVNFRFAEGSSRLDNKAVRDVDRLVAYLREPENQHKKVLLIGFGDAKQTESRAIVLSKLRASSVKRELYRAGISTMPVKGYGAFMPVAADTTQGKIKNRRVEVWVKS